MKKGKVHIAKKDGFWLVVIDGQCKFPFIDARNAFWYAKTLTENYLPQDLA